MAIEAIVTDKAPAALGPYSAAVAAPATKAIHVSGQLPIDPATGEFAGEDIQAQTRQSLTNIKNILEAAGASMADVAEVTVLLDDIADFAASSPRRTPAAPPSRWPRCPRPPRSRSRPWPTCRQSLTGKRRPPTSTQDCASRKILLRKSAGVRRFGPQAPGTLIRVCTKLKGGCSSRRVLYLRVCNC